jgi:hypothetical protein
VGLIAQMKRPIAGVRKGLIVIEQSEMHERSIIFPFVFGRRILRVS